MSEINVEEIMDEIRADIKAKGYTADMLSFNDINAPRAAFDMDAFVEAVGGLKDHKYVSWKADNIGGGVKGFFKKLIRKMVGFVVAPFADGQNIYNRFSADAFSQLLSCVEEQNEIIESYGKRLDELQKKIDELETR